MESLKSLNPAQREAVDAVTRGPWPVFCSGRGGTGKSHVIKAVAKLDAEAGHRVCILTPSNAAAQLLRQPGGGGSIEVATWHKWTRAGVDENAVRTEDLCARFLGKGEDLPKPPDLLILEEISMWSARGLCLVEEFVRCCVVHWTGHKSLGWDKSAGSNRSPFAGVRVAIFGDFRQLPPVDGSDCMGLIETWCVRQMFELQKSERAKDVVLDEWLTRMSTGALHVWQGERADEIRRALESRFVSFDAIPDATLASGICCAHANRDVKDWDISVLPFRRHADETRKVEVCTLRCRRTKPIASWLEPFHINGGSSTALFPFPDSELALYYHHRFRGRFASMHALHRRQNAFRGKNQAVHT
jgi:hypothetical protein